MVKSLAQLKRDLNVGNKLKCLEHYFRPERVGQVNEIIQKNGSAVRTQQGDKQVWLDYPASANLVVYEDNTFTIYEAGYRELTAEEKRHVEKMHELINNSYSNPYYVKKQYCREHDCEHLLGDKMVRGQLFSTNKYSKNEPCVQDNSMKGRLLYSFEIVK